MSAIRRVSILRKWAGTLAGMGLLLAFSLTAAAQPQSEKKAAPSPAPKEIRSTSKDRVSLALTLYNSNFALVREERRVQLPAGSLRLAFEDVPSTIEPSTVQLSPASGINVIDQSYEYDLLNPQSLLAKYVGKQMTLIFRGGQNGRGQESGSIHETDVPAILLSTNGPVWKIGNEIVTGIQPDGYRFPQLPRGLYNTPTLIWSLQSARSGAHTLDVSYLADKMTWEANYVLNLTKNGHQGSLKGWVTLANNTGSSFENAALSLVAGQVHRVASAQPRPVPMMAARAQSLGAVQQFTQAPAGEYHLYQLKRRVTLRSHESQQISLLSAPSVPVAETYVVQGNSQIFRTQLPEGSPTPEPVRVYLSFHNDASAGLGRPLPPGTVRVYQPDSQGNPILMGEDRIAHTPKDEMARLDIGNAFDITARRRQTDFQTVSQRVHESAFEVTLRNHKTEPVTVQVREPVGGSWQVLQSNFPAKKLNATTLEFDVPVAAGGSATLTYRIRVTY